MNVHAIFSYTTIVSKNRTNFNKTHLDNFFISRSSLLIFCRYFSSKLSSQLRLISLTNPKNRLFISSSETIPLGLLNLRICLFTKNTLPCLQIKSLFFIHKLLTFIIQIILSSYNLEKNRGKLCKKILYI